MAEKKGFLSFDTSQLDDLVTAFAETSFSFKGIEKDAEKIIAESNLEQYTSEGVYGQRFGFPKWEDLKESTLKEKERLGFGSKQKLERTGALGDALISPQVTVDSSGFVLSADFKGDHAGLIPLFQNRFPLVIVTEPEFDKLGISALDNFVNSFASRLKQKRKR